MAHRSRFQTWLSRGLWLVLFSMTFALPSEQGQARRRRTYEPLRHVKLWEREIQHYERLNRHFPPSSGGILFLGSSSIRFWKTLHHDMAPLPVANRGFGGAHLAHVNYYYKRLVLPLAPKLIVLYAGENDITAGASAYHLRYALQRFMRLTRTYLPQTQVLYLSIKPSPRRYRYWKRMRHANRVLQRWIRQQPDIRYLDVSTAMLSRRGYPRRRLFVWDRLHLNARGYALWTARVRPTLKQLWRR